MPVICASNFLCLHLANRVNVGITADAAITADRWKRLWSLIFQKIIRHLIFIRISKILIIRNRLKKGIKHNLYEYTTPPRQYRHLYKIRLLVLLWHWSKVTSNRRLGERKSYLGFAWKKVLSRSRVEKSPISASRVRESYLGDSAFLRWEPLLSFEKSVFVSHWITILGY